VSAANPWVRKLLGQENASTIEWTEARICEAWEAFLAKTGLTPSQAMGKHRMARLPRHIVNEAQRIYRPAREKGLLKELRGGRKLSRWSKRARFAAPAHAPARQ